MDTLSAGNSRTVLDPCIFHPHLPPHGKCVHLPVNVHHIWGMLSKYLSNNHPRKSLLVDILTTLVSNGDGACTSNYFISGAGLMATDENMNIINRVHTLLQSFESLLYLYFICLLFIIENKTVPFYCLFLISNFSSLFLFSFISPFSLPFFLLYIYLLA